MGDLFDHLTLKVLLNAHSTLVMGRLGRYRNNIMTWVSPTNGKLIDRACRYVLHLLQEEGVEKYDYAAVVNELFEQLETIDLTASVVEKTFEALYNK